MSADRVSYESQDRPRGQEPKIVVNHPVKLPGKNDTLKMPVGAYEKLDSGSERQVSVDE